MHFTHMEAFFNVNKKHFQKLYQSLSAHYNISRKTL